MFDTVILLTGAVEQSALTQALRRHRPALDVCAVTTLAELESIDRPTLRRARLIGFVTPVVVPADILNRIGYGAYNFHPGPPHYPGWAPSHFAIYDRARHFGATAHKMAEKVDSGPIVGVELFTVPPNTDVVGLEQLALMALARLFWNLAPALAVQDEPLAEMPMRWSGRKGTRRLCAALCDIPADSSKDELDRRIEAFGAGHLGCVPTLRLHGKEFRFVGAGAAMQAAS
jgi:methionyl-tRNA formyltransferase